MNKLGVALGLGLGAVAVVLISKNVKAAPSQPQPPQHAPPNLGQHAPVIVPAGPGFDPNAPPIVIPGVPSAAVPFPPPLNLPPPPPPPPAGEGLLGGAFALPVTAPPLQQSGKYQMLIGSSPNIGSFDVQDDMAKDGWKVTSFVPVTLDPTSGVQGTSHVEAIWTLPDQPSLPNRSGMKYSVTGPPVFMSFEFS